MQQEAPPHVDSIYEKDPGQAGQKWSDCDGGQAQKQSDHWMDQE